MATVGDQAAQLRGLPGGHAVAHRPSDREPHTPEVEQGGADLEAVGDLVDAVVQHGVAGDPQGPVGLAVPAQGEADHVAGDGAAERRAVAAGGAVTWMVGCPGASSGVVAQGWRPRVLPPSRLAPAVVVRTAPAAGSRERHEFNDEHILVLARPMRRLKGGTGRQARRAPGLNGSQGGLAAWAVVEGGGASVSRCACWMSWPRRSMARW